MKNLVSFFVMLFVCVFMQTSLHAQAKKQPAKVVKASAKPHDMLAMLQGKWASLDDKKTFFVIKGTQQTDIYGKDVLDTATINFYNEYPERITEEDPKQTSGQYLAVRLKEDDYYIYKIEKLTATSVALMYLPKGNILRYKKVK